MKKFLCYDTNDAANGKINVNSNGVLNSNATVPPVNGDASYKQLVSDGQGNVKWEDRLAYDATKTEFVGAQYLINLDPTSGTVTSQDTIPMELGQTYAVKVARNDGQGTKEYTGLDVAADDDGTLYIGSSDVESEIYPFRIAESSTTVVAAFVKGGGYNYITATCTSNGKIKTIDPKYIKDMYCDNRTMLVEQTIVTNADAQEGPVINLSLLVNGTPVTVNIDGKEYNATLEEGGTYTLGTGSMSCDYHIGSHGHIDIRDNITSTSDYPFFVVISGTGRCMVLFDGESTGTKHEFSVYSGSIKQIDPKFIPSKETFFVLSGPGFRTGTDWDAGEDVTIADIVAAYHDGCARIFQMSSGECIGISNVIGASAPGSSSPFITYYNYTSKTVFTKS